MIMLTGAEVEDIELLLDLLGEETVVEPTPRFPFRISRRAMGYSDDARKGRLQAALSISLQVAHDKRQREKRGEVT